MNKDNKAKNTFTDLIFKIIKDNERFFTSNKKREKILSEISSLMLDSIDYLPKIDFQHDPRGPFVFNALNPFSQGIYLSILSGNIHSAYMQFRLLLEYLALSFHAEKIQTKHVLDKFETTRQMFDNNELSTMMKSFDSRAFGLWKKASKWFHAKSHSRKIENIIINDKVKLWQIIQPAPYDIDDEKILSEFACDIKQFRILLKKFMEVKN